MANVNIIIPSVPPTGSTSNTVTLWQAAQNAQAALNTAAAAYQNGVLADQVTNAANPPSNP